MYFSQRLRNVKVGLEMDEKPREEPYNCEIILTAASRCVDSGALNGIVIIICIHSTHSSIVQSGRGILSTDLIRSF